jgi:hypothetical protein
MPDDTGEVLAVPPVLEIAGRSSLIGLNTARWSCVLSRSESGFQLPDDPDLSVYIGVAQSEG